MFFYNFEMKAVSASVNLLLYHTLKSSNEMSLFIYDMKYEINASFLWLAFNIAPTHKKNPIYKSLKQESHGALAQFQNHIKLWKCLVCDYHSRASFSFTLQAGTLCNATGQSQLHSSYKIKLCDI